MSIQHILIGRGANGEWSRCDRIDGAWREESQPGALKNFIPEAVRLLSSGSSAPPDITISTFRPTAELVTVAPELLGISEQARKTVAWCPLGGLHGELWGEVVYVQIGAEPLPGEKFAPVTKGEKLKTVLQDMAQTSRDSTRCEELWLRHGWRIADVAPALYPVPRWRIDQAREAEAAAAEAAQKEVSG